LIRVDVVGMAAEGEDLHLVPASGFGEFETGARQ